MKIVRWGIVGTGGIAHRFAEALCNSQGVSLEAVASRSQETANAFGDEFNIPHRFASYEEMAAFDGIDAAYIATPHGLHAENSILLMNHGKAVLSEKPITLNCNELQKMIDCAKKNDVFLMEAMWARLVPGTLKILDIINSGVLGKIKGIQASFCYDMSDEPDHHAFKPVYGGGSLLDVGCYGLSFASWYKNSPVTDIKAVADIGKTMVDEHCCVLIKYEDGAIASVSSAMTLRKPSEGYVFGEKGYIRCTRFYAPQKIELYINGKDMETIDCPYIGNGFEEQIAEASECIRLGKKESDLIPLSQSMMICRQMDIIRKQVGVKYPCDVE